MLQQFLRGIPFLFVALVPTLCGCDGKAEVKLYPVSGTVSLDGKPMPEGTIYFKTVATGSVNTLEIKDGKFQGNVEAGDRQVEINAFKVTKGNFGGMGGEVKENIVAKRFNIDTTLKADVKPGGPNEFTFEVSSK